MVDSCLPWLADHFHVFNFDFWMRLWNHDFWIWTLIPICPELPPFSCAWPFLPPANQNIPFTAQNDCVLLSGFKYYKNAILASFISHFYNQPSKIHNLLIFDPNSMGFFVLCSSWSLLFYHYFSRIFGWVVFKWC
jgi:hypothetical protein